MIKLQRWLKIKTVKNCNNSNKNNSNNIKNDSKIVTNMKTLFKYMYLHAKKQTNFHHFMEPELSLPCSKKPATCPYIQTHQVQDLQSYFLKIHFSYILPSTPSFFKWCLSLRICTKTTFTSFLSTKRTTCLYIYLHFKILNSKNHSVLLLYLKKYFIIFSHQS